MSFLTAFWAHLRAKIKHTNNLFAQAFYLQKKGEIYAAKKKLELGLQQSDWPTIKARVQQQLNNTIEPDVCYLGGGQNYGFIRFNNQAITKIFAEQKSFKRESYFYRHIAPTLRDMSEGGGIINAIDVGFIKETPHTITLALLHELDKNTSDFSLAQQAISLFNDIAEKTQLIDQRPPVELNVANEKFSTTTNGQRLLRKMTLWNLFANIENKSNQILVKRLLHYVQQNLHKQNLPQELKKAIYMVNQQLLNKTELITETMNLCLTHGDAKRDNFLLLNNKQLVLLDWGRASYLPIGYDIGTLISKLKLTHDEIEQLFISPEKQLLGQELCFLACYLHIIKDLHSHNMPAYHHPDRVSGFIYFYLNWLSASCSNSDNKA